jgi:molybdate-binding protein/DNA-binding transcriptional regulator YhcF (GntR family)
LRKFTCFPAECQHAQVFNRYATIICMEETYLYRRIADAVRRQIMQGELQPGDRLPSVREMTRQWGCTVGTVQRAYQELAAQGLVTSHAGQGTRVVDHNLTQDDTPLRRAALVHRAEAFLLEVLTAGYAAGEVEEAIRQALDRWRAVAQRLEAAPTNLLRFSGSHDPVIAWLATHFGGIAPGYTLQLQFTGSLGGLIALAEGQAALAGCHLWDQETETYNVPFVRRVLPGRRIALLRLAHRRLGLIVPAGNPAGVQDLMDLKRNQLRFINRQAGSGTRVWLDAALHRLGISADEVQGFHDEKMTHSEVARTVAEGQADVGIGLEAAALAYNLGFILLTREQYDLVIPEEHFASPPMPQLVEWLRGNAARDLFASLGGYEGVDSGVVEWVE